MGLNFVLFDADYVAFDDDDADDFDSVDTHAPESVAGKWNDFFFLMEMGNRVRPISPKMAGKESRPLNTTRIVFS